MANSLNMVLDCTSSRRIILFICFTRCACIPIIKLTFGDKLRSVAVNISFRISIPFWRLPPAKTPTISTSTPDYLRGTPCSIYGHYHAYLCPPLQLKVCVCGSCQRVGIVVPSHPLTPPCWSLWFRASCAALRGFLG